MNESQVAATVVALRAAGYEVKIGGHGVRIVATQTEGRRRASR